MNIRLTLPRLPVHCLFLSGKIIFFFRNFKTFSFYVLSKKGKEEKRKADIYLFMICGLQAVNSNSLQNGNFVQPVLPDITAFLIEREEKKNEKIKEFYKPS